MGFVEFMINKKAEQCSAFFPKSYHELNLLMLWFSKYTASLYAGKTSLLKGP